MSDLTLFNNTYIHNHADKTLVTLHGTGGGENDFLFLNDRLSDAYNILGLRGNVDENGLNRFFKRKSFTVFDQDNIRGEAGKLQQFIQAWMKKYEMNLDQFVFLGYSNGANMLLATLFYYPELLKNTVLLHPMLPFKPNEPIDLSENTILVNYSVNDELITEEQSITLIELLRSYKAQVTFKTYSTGHQLSAHELEDVITYLT